MDILLEDDLLRGQRLDDVAPAAVGRRGRGGGDVGALDVDDISRGAAVAGEGGEDAAAALGQHLRRKGSRQIFILSVVTLFVFWVG